MRISDSVEKDSSSGLSASLDSNPNIPFDGPTVLMPNSAGFIAPPSDSTSVTLENGNGYLTVLNGNGARLSIDNTGPMSNGGIKQSVPPDPGRSSGSSVARVILPGTCLFENSYIDREEFVRLVLQSLRDVGYVESAATLEAESGYRMEFPKVTDFRKYILSGHWSAAELYLPSLCVEDEDSLRTARFLISQQKYLELLEMQSVNEALNVLRNELAPFSTNLDELHSLSGLIMCSTADDLRLRATWDGAEGSSRKTLLADLQRFIPARIMMPERRFATLIEQAFTHQRTQCLYHNAPYAPETFSLYTDHRCSRSAFPLLTTTILEEHKDEVWNIKWSHDGQYLASASRDMSAIIWHIGPETEPNVRQCSLEKLLQYHKDPVGCLAWSPDDSLLLTSAESIIRVWNTKTGVGMPDLTAHEDTVSALEWLPDGSGFLSGGLDRKIIHWSWQGSESLHNDVWIKTTIRITDFAIAPDMSRLVVVGLDALPAKPSISAQEGQTAGTSNAAQSAVSNTKENRLIIYDYATRAQEASVRLDGELTSVKISQDSRYALINHAPDEVQLWDLETARLARKFTGQRQGQHIIRSCFGGVDGNFIVSGSEDGNVYVWHRDTGVLLETLGGHGAGSVNAVAWNPQNERMFASCSDDATIRIWECPHAPLLDAENGTSILSDNYEIRHGYQRPSEHQNGKGKGKSREGPGIGWSSSSGTGSAAMVGGGSTSELPTE